MRASLSCVTPIVFSLLLIGGIGRAAEGDAKHLANELRPLMACLSGQQASFLVSGEARINVSGAQQQVTLRVERFAKDSFDLDLVHPEYAVKLRRRGDATAMALPLHQVVYLGRGETDAQDHLSPEGMTRRLLSSGSTVSDFSPFLQSGDPQAVALVLQGLLKLRYDAPTASWKLGDKLTLKFTDSGKSLDFEADGHQVSLKFAAASAPAAVDDWAGLKVVELDRRELEVQLARGARRGLEIAAPAYSLQSPQQTVRKVEHGELRWIDGQRVALLHGTPEQVGRAHGELLKTEAMRCIDSVLYTFGTAQTIRTGRWFRNDLADAYARLAPHIPERHKVETRAMADSLGIDQQLAETLNVFPELFHCSGFAVFGTATVDGKLYHGRVLDYMTAIGLQDAATTFIVSVDGSIPFANVGYAGFIGSVSGMNSQGISLGEMGGRGEGQWDGAPMATLMRRALEECSTLEQVQQLWTNSPRTCEYYYVFADGKTNKAVGVAATPQSIEFVLPGQSHPLLGAGITDAVVLSAGSRLETLRERVTQRHGKIDAEVGQWLMSRPVAMQSNLHNVLFVPQDGVLYVANASHQKPAAEMPYVRLDLRELLSSMLDTAPVAAAVGGGN